MKRVLILMDNLEGGGAEKALIELLRSIDYSKYEVTLCLSFYKGVYLMDIPKKIKVIKLFKNENTFIFRKIFRYYKKHHNPKLLSFFMLYKIRKQYDAIISYMEGRPLLLHNFIVRRGRKNISWIHCDLYNYHSSVGNFYEPVSEIECYRKMDNLVFVSHLAMKNFGKVFPLSVPKSCIYNIVDFDRIRDMAEQTPITKEKFTITAIGSLLAVKGFDRLIHIAKRLKDEGYSFCIQIIGKGDKEQELLNLRDKLGVQDNVVLYGFKSNPYVYLKNSDLFISTSLSESLPYVICEAMVLGIPIVATKTTGSIELLDNGQYGLLVEQNENSIYGGICKMIEDEQMRFEYGKKSKIRALFFDKEQTMTKFYDLI